MSGGDWASLFVVACSGGLVYAEVRNMRSTLTVIAIMAGGLTITLMFGSFAPWREFINSHVIG